MKTILKAVKEKLAASGSTVADGLGGKGLTISEAIAAVELDDGGITPAGNITFTANTGSDGADISQYATVSVNVTPHLVTFNANNGVDANAYAPAIEGTDVQLPDGSGLTAPSGKSFGGWASDAAGQQPITDSAIQVSADTTVYAVWVDAQ